MRADQAVRWGWVAEQIGHRIGALALMAVCAGLGLMLAGKRPFPSLLACGFAAATIGAAASFLASRWGTHRVRGLVSFNATLFFLAAFAMVASRMNWWHVVGLLAGGGK